MTRDGGGQDQGGHDVNGRWILEIRDQILEVSGRQQKERRTELQPESRTKVRRVKTERRGAGAPPPVSAGTDDIDPDNPYNSFHHRTLHRVTNRTNRPVKKILDLNPIC